ncbi:MAG: hypothetical protein AAF936_15585 [Pseudomonadota bacterium]
MLTLLGTAFLYAASFGFYHANVKRTTFSILKASATARFISLIASWFLAFASLYIFASILGWERGIPVWLGIFTLTGALSLLVSALAPSRHAATGVGALAIGVVSAVTVYVGGGI